MHFSFIRRPSSLSFLIPLLLLLTLPGYGSDDTTLYTPEMTHADSIQVWQDAVNDDNALDITADVLVEVVYFPLRIVFTGVRESAGFINEYQVVKRLDDLLSSDDGRWRIVPIASNSTGAGAKFKFKPDPNGETQIYASSSWWLYGRQKYEISVKDLKINERRTISFSTSYRIMPEERFYDFGMASRESQLAYYKYEYTDVELVLNSIENNHTRIQIYGGFRTNNIHRASKAPSLNAVMDRATRQLEQDLNNRYGWTGITFHVPLPEDIDSMLNMGRAGLRFESSSVPNPAKPTDGTVLVLDVSYHGETNGEKFGFFKGYAKLGQYLHVYNERVVYADIEGTVTAKYDDKEYSIPFYDYPTLGGAENLRGFQRDRYRGDHSVAGTFEYRFPLRDIWGESGLDFHIFADWGQVFMEDADDLNGNMQIGYGFGFDAWNIDGSAIAFDVGFSREGVMVYLSMGL